MERLGVFNQLNIMFDADPQEVLYSIAHGGGGGSQADYRRGLIHPNMGNFFTVPIRALVETLSVLLHGDLDKRDLRRRMALLVIPISSALFYLTFFSLLLLLRFSLPLASLFTIYSFVSYSQMLFGSIPETYAISNLAIALAFLLFVISKDRSGMPCFVSWIAVGMLATGITITNIVPVLILFLLREIYKRNTITHSIIKTSGMAVIVLALTLTLNVISNVSAGYKQRSLSEETSWAKEFGTFKLKTVKRNFLTFPTILGYSIIAPVPKEIPNKFAMMMNPAVRYTFRFTFDDDARWGSKIRLVSISNLAGIVLFLILLLPARASPSVDRSLLFLSWGALLIIGFNWILHSVWGLDRILYSQHWHVSLMFLLAALVATQLRSSWVRTSLVAASIILVAANNLVVLHTMLMTF